MIRATDPPSANELTDHGVNFCHEVQQYYRALLRRLNWPASEHGTPPQTLGITSCFHGEGVSTVAAQLAATAAAMPGQRVLLVDAHLRQPGAARSFGFPTKAGFADAVLAGSSDALPIFATRVPNLSVVTAGVTPRNINHVYDSPALGAFVEELKADFELIVFDLPPCGISHAPLQLAGQLDGVLLVVEADRVRQHEARRVREMLVQARVTLLGAVLNRQRDPELNR